ncbi:MAG: cysteine desulfurase-like protein [Alphaproteobacteria bacterium]
MLSPAFPIETVRDQFPALRPGGSIFLDNPAGTQVPQRVLDAVTGAMTNDCANLDGHFGQSRRAGEIIDTAHAKAALFLGAPSPDEIAIGPSMTELTFQISRAIARACAPGDEIVVTTMEHEGNISPWLVAARDFGLTLRWVAFDEESWRIEPEALAEVLSERTRVVALNYASNMTGSINDARALTALAHDAGALVYIDAVQFAPHGLIDVVKLGCDFLVCSAYKFFGPHLGILWGREALLRDLAADRLRCGPTGPGAKFERGTPQIELQAGLSASIDHFEWLGRTLGDDGGARSAIATAFTTSREYEHALTCHLVDGLKAIDGVSIKGITASNRMYERVPTISMTCASRSSDSLAAALARRGINGWSGHNYALAGAEQLGLDLDDGVLRLGLAHYNSESEVEATLEAVREECSARGNGAGG